MADPGRDEQEAVGDDDVDGPRRRVTAPVVTAVVALVVIAGLVTILATRAPATDRIAGSPIIGNPAPPLAGRTTNGDEFDIRDERGRWVVVNFFATWCAPCRQEHPALLEWEARNRATGEGTLVTVVFDDDLRNILEFFEQEGGGTWPVLDGDGGSMGLDWGVIKVPESYIVDPDGIVRAKIVGGVTLEGLDGILADLQAAS